MIGHFLSFQFGGFYGGSFGNFLYQLESLGFFSYVLPFLIIFALVFGVLSRMNLFGVQNNKKIYAIISLAVSLLALQFGVVSQFFSDIFPRLGIWLAVILVMFIIMGFFNPTKQWSTGLMILLGIVILGIILYQTFGLSWYSFGYWLPYNWGVIVVIVIIIVAIGLIISSTPQSKPFKFPEFLRDAFARSEYT